MAQIIAAIIAFLGPVADAIRRTINLQELIRVVITAMSAGGSIWTILLAIQTALGSIVVDPSVLSEFQTLFKLLLEKNWIGLGVLVVTMVVEIFRRYYQGARIRPNLPIIKREGLDK